MDREPSDWRKASYSNGSGDCVEVGTAPDSIAVRDTMNRDGAALAFSAGAWKTFAATIKNASPAASSL